VFWQEGRIMGNPWQHRASIALAAVLVLVVFAVRPARAQTFKVLHTFHSGEGPQGPSGQLILDKEGNLYGVAQGGTGTCFPNFPCGTVFKMTKAGKLIWVYNFKVPGTDGNEPAWALLRDETGNLFGVTTYGGVNTNACSDNFSRICGVVFKLDPTGKKETVLHRFTGNSDGMNPVGPLIEDSVGNLYGTTNQGSPDLGTVFKVSQEGKEKVLFSFFSFHNAAFPSSGVVRDSAGNLYGETGYGGTSNCNGGGCGTVYELDATGHETVLYNFTGGSDGYFPAGGLTWDKAGNLYGTAIYGGSEIPICTGGEGCGTVYRLSPNSNGSWTETTLYKFCPGSACIDGSRPNGGVIRDSAGNLYGTTSFGGIPNCDGESEGCGVVFKLDPSGKETVLHTFTGGADGAFPNSGLVMDASGNLYGVTGFGGDAKCHVNGDPGCGVVFKITP
jgi:uncharacterized repeat protein (TIGR03803 family)